MLYVQYTFFICLMLTKTRSVPSKASYCKLPCPSGTQHTVCQRDNCKPVAFCRQEHITYEIRKALTDAHNSLRNNLALGKEPDVKYTAANMRLLNYDMELEYIAQCYGNQCTQPKEDPCRITSRFSTVAQITQMYDDMTFNILKWLEPQHVAGRFRNAYKDQKHTLDDSNYENVYTGKQKDKWKYNDPFVQMIWAESDHIGCAINTQRTNKTTYKYSFRIVCYYSNIKTKGKKLFIVGPACSKCPSGTKCNERFTGLCGKTEPISKDSSYGAIFPDDTAEAVRERQEMEEQMDMWGVDDYELFNITDVKKGQSNVLFVAPNYLLIVTIFLTFLVHMKII